MDETKRLGAACSSFGFIGLQRGCYSEENADEEVSRCFKKCKF